MAYMSRDSNTLISFLLDADTRNKTMALAQLSRDAHTLLSFLQNADTRNKAVALTEKLFKTYGHKVDPFLKGVESEATRKLLRDK